jgi:adenylosuccinate lyase
MVEVVRGLQVNEAAMRDNLQRTNGLVFSEALSLRLSRAVADGLVEQAVRDGKPLREVVEASRALPPEQVAALFDVKTSYGASRAMIERVLADWTSARESAP